MNGSTLWWDVGWVYDDVIDSCLEDVVYETLYGIELGSLLQYT